MSARKELEGVRTYLSLFGMRISHSCAWLWIDKIKKMAWEEKRTVLGYADSMKSCLTQNIDF